MPVANPRNPRIRRLFTPKLIVGVATGYVVVSLLLIYAVDVRDAFGLRTTMLGLDMDHPGVWYHIFGTRKITEVLQWGLLATTAVLAGMLGGRLGVQGQAGAGAFWSLISVATAFMLMEDAGNVRKILADYFVDLFPEHATPISLGFALLVFGFITAVALYAIVRHGASVWHVTACRPYIVLAYLLLALGALSDVWERAGFYEVAGLFVHHTVAQGQLVLFPGYDVATQAGLFMDSVWEEGLELVGYSSFLAAVVSYWYVVVTPDELGRIDSTSSHTSQPVSEGHRSVDG